MSQAENPGQTIEQEDTVSLGSADSAPSEASTGSGKESGVLGVLLWAAVDAKTGAIVDSQGHFTNFTRTSIQVNSGQHGAICRWCDLHNVAGKKQHEGIYELQIGSHWPPESQRSSGSSRQSRFGLERS